MDKNKHVQEIAIFKALGDETRLRILRLLYKEELNVQELAWIMQLSQPKISRHLSVLRQTEMVQDRKEGTKVYYTISPLNSSMSAITGYIHNLTMEDHPDLDQLKICLQNRASTSQTFADSAADEWDQIGRLLHNTSASLLSLSHLLPKTGTLVDLGTGTGVMLPFLSTAAEHVYAVDQSAKMLDKARERCETLGLDNITFIQSAAEDLSARLPECDGILLHFVLHQIASPQRLFSNITPKLKKGGHLVVVDRTSHQDEQAKATFGSIWLGFTSEQLTNWAQHAQLHKTFWHPLTPAENKNSPDLFVFSAVRP